MTFLPRPSELFDRNQEWSDLADFVSSTTAGLRLAVVSGRRRQGKSFLLRGLARASQGLYHQAQELERSQALARFGDDVARSRHLPAGALRFDDWDIAFRTALQYPVRGERAERPPASGGPRILILDELPYLLAHSPEIPSVLQELIDESRHAALPSGSVIVCGSALSVMTELLSGTKPLRGRAQLDLTLLPFGYRQAASYWGISDPDVAFHVDAVLGGTAGYKALIEAPVPEELAGFPGWLGRSVLNPAHALFNETDYLLREDPRITDKQIYNSVLSAVATGAHSPTKIGGIVGRDINQLRHPLQVLESAGFLSRSEDVLVQRRPSYTITDPVVRFSQVVIEPFRVMLEDRDAAGAWASAQPDFRSRVLGPHFEKISRLWTSNAPDGTWSAPIGVVGTTVVNDSRGRAQHEVDVIALHRGDRRFQDKARIAVIGEAKSGGRERTLADLERLLHIRDLLSQRGLRTDGAQLAIFGRSGFARNLQRVAAKDDAVRLVSLRTLYGD